MVNVQTLVVGDLFTNCYILDPETKEVLVVDPGGDAPSIVQTLQGKGLHPRYIVATHAHFDHICGMKELQDALGGETLLHRADLPLLESLPTQGAAFGVRTGPIPRIDRFLEEGDQIPLGQGHFRVLHTPGHSPGGISLIGHGMAFVGDALFAGSIGRTDLPGSSYETLLDSIRRKLFTLKEDTLIFPGHGEATTIGAEMRGNPFLTVEDRL